MAQTFTRTRSTWMVYLLLAFYGYFLNILGPVTPFLMDEMRLSYTQSSLHFTAFALGIILAGIGGHRVIRRIGAWNALWTGAVGMSLGAILLIAGRSPVVTVSACLLMGLVGSLILAVVPSALANAHGEGRAVAISEANLIASLISAFSPVLVGWFAAGSLLPASLGGWRLALVIGLVFPIFLYLGTCQSPLTGEAEVVGTNPDASLPIRYWVYWSALVLSISVEFCMVFWSADFVEKSLGVPKAQAAQAVSLFLAGMILGRLAGSRLVARLGASRVINASLLVAIAGFLLYWRSGSAFAGLAGLLLTGLGVASMYPLILSQAIGAAPGMATEAGARSSLASGTAIFTLPLVLGRLADGVGIRQAYAVVLVLLVLDLLVIQFSEYQKEIIH